MTDGLTQIQEKSRLTFRYWPILLVLRVREIEQHMETEGERGLLGPPTAQTLLRQYDLWNGREDDMTTPPKVEMPAGSNLVFAVDETDGGTVLSATATDVKETWRLDLMRVPPEHADLLSRAADTFNRMRNDHAPGAALDAARLWGALHGARSLSWRVVVRNETNKGIERALVNPGMGLTSGTIEEGGEPTEAADQQPPTRKRRGRGQGKPSYRGFGGG